MRRTWSAPSIRISESVSVPLLRMFSFNHKECVISTQNIADYKVKFQRLYLNHWAVSQNQEVTRNTLFLIRLFVYMCVLFVV